MYQTADPDSAGPQRLGRYELLEKLDSGGMGAIYLARLRGEGGFEKLVVLKVLLPELSESQRFVAMFLDEAKIAARLGHPNVCEVYELGAAGGRHFIAMQYLRGVPLTRAMAPAGDPIDHVRFIASVIAQAAEGLHHAHELRGPGGEALAVIHRDVSPPNLFVTVDGVVKVLDFGIAKARDIDSKTRRDEVKGKQSYMSPEQLVGEQLDRRSDLFSLGVVLYEGITGSRLFSRDTDYLVAKAILEDDIEDPRRRQPAIGDELAAACLKALARDRADRFATAREMGEALAAALGPAGGPMTPAAIGERVQRRFAADLDDAEAGYRRATELAARIDSGVAAAPPVDTGAVTESRAGSRRARLAVAAAGVAVLIAALITAFALGRDSAAPAVQAQVDAGAAVLVAAPPADAAAIEIDAAASAVDAAPAPDAARSPRARPGFISIDSTPYATIYVDGREAGVTPLIRYRVKPGRRRIRAVTAGGAVKRFSVEVKPGKLARPRHLRW